MCFTTHGEKDCEEVGVELAEGEEEDCGDEYEITHLNFTH